MDNEYFFTANSNGFMLSLHFFDRQEAGKIYLNMIFNFGNSRQNLECESVGYWLNFHEVVRFRDNISKNNFSASLADVDGGNLFEISRNGSEVLLSHRVLNDSSYISDKFDLKFVIDSCFVDELVEGLHGWLFETPNQ